MVIGRDTFLTGRHRSRCATRAKLVFHQLLPPRQHRRRLGAVQPPGANLGVEFIPHGRTRRGVRQLGGGRRRRADLRQRPSTGRMLAGGSSATRCRARARPGAQIRASTPGAPTSATATRLPAGARRHGAGPRRAAGLLRALGAGHRARQPHQSIGMISPPPRAGDEGCHRARPARARRCCWPACPKRRAPSG